MNDVTHIKPHPIDIDLEQEYTRLVYRDGEDDGEIVVVLARDITFDTHYVSFVIYALVHVGKYPPDNISWDFPHTYTVIPRESFVCAEGQHRASAG